MDLKELEPISFMAVEELKKIDLHKIVKEYIF